MLLAKLRYHDFFTDYDEVNSSELIKDIASKYMLEKISLSIMKLLREGNKNHVQMILFNLWTEKQPLSIRSCFEYVAGKIDLKKRIISFIDNNTYLVFVDMVLDNYNNLNIDHLSEDQELRLFKAYMYCLQKWNDKQEAGIRNISRKLNPADYVLSSQFYLRESLVVQDSGLQIIKAIYFFQFCDKDPVFYQYLQFLLKKVNVDNWRNYLRSIMAFYGFNLISSLANKGILLEIENENTSITSFLKEMTIDVNTYTGNRLCCMVPEW